MIKIIGTIILLTSGILSGLIISEKYSARVEFLRSYVEFLNYLKNEITYSGKTLTEIFINYNCKEPLKTYFKECIKGLKNNNFEKSWENAFYNIHLNTGILKEEENMIIDLVKNLGNFDTQEQINDINYNLTRAEYCLKNANETKKSKKTLPIVLTSGLSLAIALILL